MVNKEIYGIGIMTGTSLDGCDIAYIKIKDEEDSLNYELIHYESYPLSDNVKHKILKESNPETSSVSGICQLNFELGKMYSNYVTQFKLDYNISVIDYIANHGQTIYHHPNDIRSTLQIGDPSYLAYDNQTLVVSDFRTMDIAAGGSGAPLVPYTDYLLFSQPDKTVCCLNIGGIANVTILPKGGNIEDVVAFDTGPGNMMINAAMKHLYQKPYDDGGQIGLTGNLDTELMNELLNEPYLKVKPPKSTGRELFGEDFVVSLIEKYKETPNENLIHTLSAFTSKTITDALESFVDFPIDEIIISGGGAYNQTIINELRNRTTAQVITQEALGNSSDAKEAIAFALLWYQTLKGRHNNVPKATGAIEPVVLGKITNGKGQEII